MDFEEECIVSLSKGCFVHKPTAEKKRKHGKIHSNSQNITYKPLWDRLNTQIQVIEENAYKETFDAITDFINDCFQFPLQEISEIPTAMLVMGVNMPDHSHIFHLLEEQLHLKQIFGTVVLQSKKCNNFPSILQNVVSEFIDAYQKIMNLEDYPLKKSDHTFRKLYSYYKNLPEKQYSPSKRKSAKTENVSLKTKPLVILIQDVEAFSSMWLQELILNCSLYLGKLPFVFVFGMASAMVTLHNILPQKVLCCLGIQTFRSLTATEYLTKIIEEVIISPHVPFKLGPRVFKLIVDTVLYHDFSISNLQYLLKFCMTEHFYNKGYAILCCDEDDIETNVKKLTTEDLKLLKSLPSFQVFIDNNPHLQSSINEPTVFKVAIVEHLEKLCAYQKFMMVLIRCLHYLTKDLPGYPLGKQLRELYSLVLEKEITITRGYAEAERFLRMLSHTEMLSKLNLCLEVVLGSELEIENSILAEAKQTLKSCIEMLSTMSSDDVEKDTSSDPLNFESDKITSRSQLQQRILASIKLKRSKFDCFRNEIIEMLLQIFKHIRPPSRLPFHEIFYFNDVVSVKTHLMAVPRVTLHHALVNPQLYLKCKCCKIADGNEITASMPDICILYKTHLESGKLINLFDWLESFKSIKESEQKRKSSTKAGENADLNTRFMEGVSTLQLLGFIKPTKRKTDHMARLTFGSF